MIWTSIALVILPVSSSFAITKGAFVGAFLSDGKALTVTPPLSERWVSAEQVKRELLFRDLQPPLTTTQMAELAKSLEADFAADVLAVAFKDRKGRHGLIVLRIVSAYLQAIVHLAQERVAIKTPDELAQTIRQALPKLIASLPSRFPTVTVQMIEDGKRLHLLAREGTWRKGMELLVWRMEGSVFHLIGTSRITKVRRTLTGTATLLEANLLKSRNSVHSGDKAIAIYRLPASLAQWQ